MFVGRRPDGTIYGTWTSRQPEDSAHQGIEEVDDDSKEIAEFRKQQPGISKVNKAIIDAVLNDPQVPDTLKALLNVLPDTKADSVALAAVLES